MHNTIRVGKVQLPILNVILFAATLCTTFLINGPWYALSIMTILLSHELGHFFMCRKYNVEATLPFFLPIPFPPFGTFGAVIKMKGYIPSKKALFDIGAAGPIAGLVFAIPIIIIGLCCSKVVPTHGAHYMSLGEPILFSVIAKIVFGTVAEGSDILLHPIAFAGWAGLFVTALNLLPIGQLDGGHILYALLGEKKSKIVFKIGVFGFCLIAILVYHGWVLFAVLLLLFGFRHPAPVDAITNIGSKRRWIGIGMFILFFLSFTPIPMTFY
ncbi:MAG: site-2 protease family protein [Candidatus Anammoxibacter sp.]